MRENSNPYTYIPSYLNLFSDVNDVNKCATHMDHSITRAALKILSKYVRVSFLFYV